MPKNYHLRFFVFISLLLLSYNGFSQLSKTHYIPPLTNADSGSSRPQDQYIYISTPRNSNIPFTIIPVGQTPANYITGVVSNATPQEISIGSGSGQLFIPSNITSLITNNRGFIIEAEDVIYVSVRMNAGFQAGALVSKGLSSLGTTFRVGSYTNENPQDNYLNFVSVMATEDDTQVNFSNLPAGLIIKNYTGTTPVNVTLDEGESYTIATNSNDTAINRDGLIGCLVNSNKPIVVNCGSANGSFGNGEARDYGIDQIVDLNKVGTEYIFVRGDGNNDWENALIVAHTDNTTISINGNTPIATIDAGQYYVIEGNNYSPNGNMYVETSQPVFAYQGVGGLGSNGTPSEANQGMFFVPPLSCETRGNLDNIANINNIGNTNYDGGISIVSKIGATVTINNNPITVAGNLVTGKPDYITYKVKGLNGNISVQSDDELYCAYFNYNGAATSGSFYSGFPSNPEINFDAQFATLGNCIPNITLEAANAQSFDSFRWLFDDGSGAGFSDLMVTNSELKPTIPGKYKLVGIISCTGEELESVEVPISLCPDDTDNDGIIDNIDIDNDNDGILNCEESRGDVVLDLSNTRPPILQFQDGTTNTTIATNNTILNTTSASSIGLTGTGNIISTISGTTDSENVYTLSFTEPVNMKFSEDTSYLHNVIDDESFTVNILPNTKNITLVDPSNRLLVDSNFDGIFETGVTQISNSEIRFKINPSPTGNTPYIFYGSQVDSFTLVHNQNNTTQTSSFQGQVSLTCFKNDNDLDGVPDAYDFDSDNDGIPDRIENQGTLVTLSGIDADLNGLDDIFNSSALPIDTDNDTVLDFYDLDSDNDGIYDVIETGQLGTLSDTDLNGIVDDPNFGVNGWADAAETTPDSNEIGYVLNDLDNDLIFSYIDSDSDGDTCSDVFEAGFEDENTDTFLGNNPPIVNNSGLVNNATNGYTLPDANYLDMAPLSITTQPIDTETCEASNTIISVVSVEAESYQWEFSTDGVTWNVITDNANYSNSQTADLNITNTPLTFNTYNYRVKMDRSGNSCGLFSEEMELTVNPMATVTSPVVLIQCDDENLSTLGFSAFNLTEANNEISTNAVNQTFSYYLTQTAAISGDITSPDYINNPTTFENRTISIDAVWARIESPIDCASAAQIQLNVSTTVLPPTFVAMFNQCDDFLDIDGNDNANNDDRDGIATFDFSSVTTTILSFIPAGQNVLPPRYYRNEADALAEINEIIDISNYRNIGYPNSQFIYVRVDSAITNDCLGLGAHIQLNVEALPLANSVSIDRQCDDDSDDQFPFDTSQIESDVLTGQNPADFTFSYVDELGNALPSPLPNPFLTVSQTITIRISNAATTAPDGPCYDETTLEFIVDKQPIIANTVFIPPVCDDGLDTTDKNDGLHSFDTSTFESTIRGSQSNMDIFFNYIDENGSNITNATTLPNPLISGNQTVTVDVVNPMNTICSVSTTIVLIVNSVPEFSLEEEITVCGLPFTPFDLEPIQTNLSENFLYEWTFQDGTPVGNTLILPNIPQPGMYTLTLTNSSTFCTNSLTVDVKSVDPPNISINDVDIKDLKDNNSVTILDPSSLGDSIYLFSLVSEDGNIFFPYQDSPVFNNVKPGFYKLFVRDNEDLCDEVSIDISIIGHQKFFTPNGDGVNEFWQIQGLDASQANSVIQIYDRYGKLLKQLSPFEKGWDGTFNGTLMSTGDYWFKLELQDKRTLMGHFTLKR